MSKKILITASTGNIGQHIVEYLQNQNTDFYAATRKPEKMEEKGVAARYLDYESPESFPDALNQIDTLFLCGPSGTPNAAELLMPLVDKAIDQGVSHVVFIASHPQVKEKIEQSGMEYTFLQANFFMENFIMYQQKDIRDNQQIFLPCGDGKAAFVACKDLGHAAANILQEPNKYHKQTLYLTGPEALDHYQVAEVFSEILGKGITYQNPDEEAYRTEMSERGFDDEYIEAMINVFGMIKKGKVGKTSPSVENLLGRKPVALADFVEENQQEFR